MRFLLYDVLWKRGGRTGLVIAAAAFLVGLAFIMIAIQLHGDVSGALKSRFTYEQSHDYIIMNKKVGLLGSLSSMGSSFSSEEINKIKEKPYVSRVVEVVANDFHTSAYIEFGNARYKTELFFESVPDAVLDEVPSGWGFEPGQQQLPVMISRDFLALYNFGFASSRGLPMISEGSAGAVPFNVQVSGNGRRHRFDAKLAGFTSTVSSILVPMEFMKWANGELGSGSDADPKRLIVFLSDRKDPDLKSFMNKNNYQASKEMLALSEIAGIVRLGLAGVGGLGIAFLVLAAAICVLSLELVLTRAEREIRTLILIGYDRWTIARHYVSGTLVYSILALLISVFVTWFLHNSISGLVETIGLSVPSGVSSFSVIIGILIVCTLILLNFLVVFIITTKYQKGTTGE